MSAAVAALVGDGALASCGAAGETYFSLAFGVRREHVWRAVSLRAIGKAYRVYIVLGDGTRGPCVDEADEARVYTEVIVCACVCVRAPAPVCVCPYVVRLYSTIRAQYCCTPASSTKCARATCLLAACSCVGTRRRFTQPVYVRRLWTVCGCCSLRVRPHAPAPRQRQRTDVKVLSRLQGDATGHLFYGRLQVVTKVYGYWRVDSRTLERVSSHALDLPSVELYTHGLWFDVDAAVGGQLDAAGISFHGGVHAIMHTLAACAGLYALLDRADVGMVCPAVDSDTCAARRGRWRRMLAL